MTFDEANKIVEAFDEDPELEDWMPDSKVYKIIEGLREEYAPTVEMTKNDRDILLHNLQNYPFDVFAESIALSDKEKFGLPASKEFKGLSIEDLMKAWLHPETIKIVDE
ncbi:hypothetical protein [Leuconostoc gasicomitatum]|uniref:hypothetical protein n=1 Tax=Leuconostoc gasicomitatum TaxID=115778 RepID=UPI001CC4DB2F|nr:hypothetical protein [Leuconostoc gasicomitatum]MBZ5951064.1 hypothetical protein [Leuconostoc gasicomitatum]